MRFWPALQRLLPFLTWLPRTNRATLRADAIAGVTVALVAVPQSLAYAQLAGLPAYYGLYAALFPTLVGALFGSSAQLSTGPVALTSLLAAASIAPLAAAGSPEFVACAIALALLSGLFQIGFGVLRLGVLLNLLSHPVLMGFVNAAAILIALSQIPSLFGVPPGSTGHLLHDTWLTLWRLDEAHGYSLAFGASTIAMLVLLRRLAPLLPGVLIVAATLTAVSHFLDYSGHGGRVLGEIPHGLPGLTWPAVDWSTWTALLPAALVIAVISFMEAMSSAKIASIKTAIRWDENQELIGQGLAKVAAALSQTMPVSGSFSRSALNLASGARSGVSSVICALCVLLTVLFFTPLLKPLPQPVLAGIIMVALANLISLRSLRNAWRASGDDAAAALLTFGATLAFAPRIQNGMFAGVLLSLGLFIYRRMRPRVEVAEPGSGRLARDLPADLPPAMHGTIGVVRFDASLVFVNASYFEAAVFSLEQSYPALRFVLVSAHSINHLDASGVEMLSGLIDGLGKKGIVLGFSAVNPRVLAVFDRTGLTQRIGRQNFFRDDREAFAALGQRGPPDHWRIPGG